MSNPKLVLIDGHSLAFRALHALPSDMATPAGELTNAVFGFCSMLLKVLSEQNPEYVAVSFDVGKTFRHEMYQAYKGHRERTPEELEPQVRRIQQIVTALNIPIFTKENYEADDVLSTLARRAEAEGVDSVIVTGDRDILQVVDEHISVLTSGQKFSDTIIYTPESVTARYGIRPAQIVDYKALIGDKSDNIPGVRGIGDKGAATLLQTFETLDNIYAHLDEITNKRTRAALEEGRESAFLSQKLARIVTDVPIGFDLQTCLRRGYDRSQVVVLFQELSFRSLVDRLPPANPVVAGRPTGIGAAAPAAGGDGAEPQMRLFADESAPAMPAPVAVPRGLEGPYTLVVDEASLQAVAENLAAAPAIGFDTETTGTDPHASELVGVSLAWGEDLAGAAYIPVRAPDGPILPWQRVREVLQPVFADPHIAKVGHNAGFDLALLNRGGISVAGDIVDTMIGEFLLEPGGHNLGLKDLAWTRLHVEMTRITDLIGTGKTQLTMDQVPADAAGRYASADAAVTLRLAGVILPELEEKGLTRLFREVEMPLVPVLVAMERAGIRLDVAFLRQMSADLTARLRQLEQDICQIAGRIFNINSTQQLSDVLFGKLALPTEGLKKTQSGSYSTAADVLEGLRGKHEVIEMILEQRQLTKLLGTYVDALPALVNPATGRLHTSFNQTGAETGRVSSNSPNLQNIPVRTEVGREIRRAFLADPGWQLLSADYSQVELRILAHRSQDPNLLAAFGRGEDIHASAAAAVYGIPLAQVSKQQRDVAKMMNFATSYGVSAYGLAQRTGLSYGDAEQFMARYFASYPGVKRYLEETKAFARQNGYVETLLGRRRYFPVLRTTSTNQRALNVRQAAERAAINHPIQGTAADIIKIAMIHLYDALQRRGMQARMLLQVHDELVLEVPDGELTVVAPLVKAEMEEAYELAAPLKVDMEAGPNWYELHKVEG
ncbi:MAG TPA: DNA polymerase I, partial [Anaerolineae bacterium]